MIEIDIDTTGFQRALQDAEALAGNIARRAERDVKARAPQRTGKLRRSITARAEGDAVAVYGRRYGVPRNVQPGRDHHFADEPLAEAATTELRELARRGR